MRLLIRSILRRARSRVSLCVYEEFEDGDGDGCSTTGVFPFNVWGSGRAYDFNNEHRDTNSDMKRKENVQHSKIQIHLQPWSIDN